MCLFGSLSHSLTLSLLDLVELSRFDSFGSSCLCLHQLVYPHRIVLFMFPPLTIVSNIFPPNHEGIITTTNSRVLLIDLSILDVFQAFGINVKLTSFIYYLILFSIEQGSCEFLIQRSKLEEQTYVNLEQFWQEDKPSNYYIQKFTPQLKEFVVRFMPKSSNHDSIHQARTASERRGLESSPC